MKTRIQSKSRAGTPENINVITNTVMTGEYGTLVTTETANNAFPCYVQPDTGETRERYPEIDVRKSIYKFYLPLDIDVLIDQEIAWNDKTFQILEIENRWRDGKYVKLVGVSK